MLKTLLPVYSRILFLICIAMPFNALAAKVVKKPVEKISSYQKPIETSIVVHADTGKVLHAKNARTKIYPASLTKVMTLYMAFEAIDNGKLSMNTRLKVSKRAESMRPCKLGLKAGETISVRDAILALIVKSANDASVVLAEGIAGSEPNFAKLMTLRARQLGMSHTYFANASGWHDPLQKTTAADLAKLAIAIKRDYPKHYHLFSKTSFSYKGKVVNGHNRVTKNYSGAEGMKTGYTGHAGYNLITTASRGGKSLVAVVTGSSSGAVRDSKMVALLDKHFGVAPAQKQNQRNNQRQKKRSSVVASN